MEIKNAVALVTGGASGLGKATVENFIQYGAKAIILDRDAEHGQAAASELGDSVRFVETDVTREEAVQNAIDTAIDTFGAVHVAVNCAGIGVAMRVVGKEGPMPLDYFQTVININLVGTFNVIRLAANAMMQNEPNADEERGVIINTASVAAFDGQIG
ncbi:MAG TPA: SDR family NAD(P)-dependent oxidoreductase, partial [Aggregatilineales bacterium]|nr:SDR family NAD(P)-dependent oxidoreductase [Aggregatilineales bacterium]